MAGSEGILRGGERPVAVPDRISYADGRTAEFYNGPGQEIDLADFIGKRDLHSPLIVVSSASADGERLLVAIKAEKAFVASVGYDGRVFEAFGDEPRPKLVTLPDKKTVEIGSVSLLFGELSEARTVEWVFVAPERAPFNPKTARLYSSPFSFVDRWFRAPATEDGDAPKEVGGVALKGQQIK